MNNSLRPRFRGALSALSLASLAVASAASAQVAVKDQPRPAGITLQNTDPGVVFADKNGMTIYTAAFDNRRNESACTDEVAVLGDNDKGDLFPFPNLDTRATCLSQHPLVSAEGGKPVGLWTIIDRPDGKKQWSYDGRPLYTSIKDTRPGEINAAGANGNQGSLFRPILAPVILPPEIRVGIIGDVRVLTTSDSRRTIYISAADTNGKSRCENECLQKWHPVLAPEIVKEQGGWTVVKRADESRQWAFKGKPVYTFDRDSFPGDYKGNGQRGWEIALAQPLPKRPEAITITNTVNGPRYGDKNGITLYTWRCTDPGLEGEEGKTECDNPQDRSLWWVATCTNLEKCADHWRPMLADDNAKAEGATWSIITLQDDWAPVRAAAGQAAGKKAWTDGGKKAWAYKGGPVFTYKFEDRPGMSDGENTGLRAMQRWTSILADGHDINQPNQTKKPQEEARAVGK